MSAADRLATVVYAHRKGTIRCSCGEKLAAPTDSSYARHIGELQYGALKAAGYAVVDVESADELAQLRACMDRLMALADRWMSKAGPGSKAETVYGEQVVTVRFAVDNIRAALNAEADE